MIKVLQCFKFLDRIEKPEYTAQRRKFIQQRERHAISTSGYMEKGVLYLPEAYRTMNPTNQELVVLEDSFNTQKWHSQAHFFKKPSGTYEFDIFRINCEENGIELGLNYKFNSSLIGAPSREDHKFATLKIGKPLRYLLNGKSDFTLTGRKQRTFNEFEYYFQLLGEADRIIYASEVNVEKDKTIPRPVSTVDERKLFR